MDDWSIINMDGWTEEEKQAFYGEYVSTLVVNYLINLKENGLLDEDKIATLSKDMKETKTLDDLAEFFDKVVSISGSDEKQLITVYQSTSKTLNDEIKYNYIKGMLARTVDEKPELEEALKKSEETGDHSHLLNLVINNQQI